MSLEDEIKSYARAKAIHFAEWVDMFCTKSFNGYFIPDGFAESHGASPYTLNEYSIEELYDIYLAQCVENEDETTNPQ